MEVDDQSFHGRSVLIGALMRAENRALCIDDDPVGAAGQIVPQTVPGMAALAVRIRAVVAEQMVALVGKPYRRAGRPREGRAVKDLSLIHVCAFR